MVQQTSFCGRCPILQVFNELHSLKDIFNFEAGEIQLFDAAIINQFSQIYTS